MRILWEEMGRKVNEKDKVKVNEENSHGNVVFENEFKMCGQKLYSSDF